LIDGNGDDMLEADLIALHPQLFHMAEAGSWPGIRDNGLLTTEMIVNSSSLDAADRDALLRQRRPRSTRIDHPTLGDVVIRDQGPLNLAHLRLTDQNLEEWLHELNSRVFFWLHPDKLAGLLNARQYRSEEHDVLTVDTASLLAAVANRTRLSPVNSGATLWASAPPRGSATFARIEDYDYPARRRARGKLSAIVELAVSDGVPDIRDHVTAVRRMRGNVVLKTFDLSL
jgi:hypothetical protein